MRPNNISLIVWCSKYSIYSNLPEKLRTTEINITHLTKLVYITCVVLIKSGVKFSYRFNYLLLLAGSQFRI
jgi:hypothetical protein